MTAVTAETKDASPPISARSIVAVVIGNWFEFYDFIVYTFFAVMIAEAFFPGTDSFLKLLGSLITFGVGFATRPLGAAIIGAYADRAGRRAALTLTLVLMAIGSAVVGLTPSYASIGIWAPIILLAGRLLQGFSCGGEVGPATAYLMEAAPAHRRAALTSWQAQSQQMASIIGAGVGVILAFTLDHDQLYAWGWRIPFLLGILIAPLGLYIRSQLPETIEKHETHDSASAVLWTLLKHHWWTVLLGIFIICGGTVSTYVFNFMTTYAINTLHICEKIATTLTFTGAIASIVGLWLGAWAADRFPRKPVLVITRIVFIVAIYPAWQILASVRGTGDCASIDQSAMTLIGLNMALNFLFATGIGGSYAFLTEAFPKAVRSSGLAILYALGVMIFGGTTQPIILWLIEKLHDPLAPAWYQIAANIAATIAVILLRPNKENVAQA
ncbi:MAG: MFS transporter [Alphaproteobacteria bacterium]|nr:MFS transporter [Alphaproteobacteria bacterium]